MSCLVIRRTPLAAMLGASALALAACSGADALSSDKTTVVQAGSPEPTTPSTPASTPVTTAPGTYATMSPHWGNIRVQVSDYRIGYIGDATARTSEYTWTAGHFDAVTLDYNDTRGMAAYRQLNPNASVMRYALNLTTIIPGDEKDNTTTTYYHDMQAWYAKHPEYKLETAFLHDGAKCAPAAATEACRVVIQIWATRRWVVNPADAGLRAYQGQRLAGAAADADGLFLDEHSAADIADPLASFKVAEYPDLNVYLRDMVSMVAAEKAAVGTKILALNTSNYTTSWEAQLVAAAKAAHMEAINSAFSAEMEKRWTFIETALAAGARLEMPAGGTAPSGYSAGNSATAAARQHLFELASYYMVMPAAQDRLFFNPGVKWSTDFASQWLKAIETDIGAPTAGRKVIAEGKDGTGHAYRVWSRDYDRALVVARPVVSWDGQQFGDESKATVTLPSGDQYRPLQADGTLGAAVTTIALRTGEAAILIKASRTGTN